MSAADRAKTFATIAVIVVVASVVAGLYMMGSPAHQRDRKLDEMRERDLSEIAWSIDIYWHEHKALPPALPALSSTNGPSFETTDPGTSVAYEYIPTADSSYQLCAHFATDSADSSGGDMPYRDVRPYYDQSWSHHRGRQCFPLHAHGKSND